MMATRAKPTVGLTGGIASGKSTVAATFRDLGVPIVDADAVAREVVLPGTPGLTAIVSSFGPEVLLPDGSLDRKKLGERIFGDEAARRTLNAITHPRIAAESARRVAELSTGPAPYVIYEAALLVENGLARAFDALVVVAVDPETQVRRLMARDGIDEAAARGRLATQLPLEDKIAMADHVIDNGGTREETRRRVEEVHRALSALGGAS
jgi:dephospho-CoA kinase